MTDRTELAYGYHKMGRNCAQSVLMAFQDKTGLSEAESLSVAAGFGGGLRTGEVCGAISGAVMTLGLLFPWNDADLAAKERIRLLTIEFQKRFSERFGSRVCRDLLEAELKRGENTPAADRLEVDSNCNVFIVTAVEILEEMLAEQ